MRRKPKARLNTRIAPALALWLEGVAGREGWSVTETTEWALSGARLLEHRLAARGALREALAEQRAGGESVYALAARLMEAALPVGSSVAAIVPPHRKGSRGRAA